MSFLNLALIDFGIQTVAGIVSIVLQTEKFYDLTGALTYILMCVYDLRQTPNRTGASTLIANVINFHFFHICFDLMRLCFSLFIDANSLGCSIGFIFVPSCFVA